MILVPPSAFVMPRGVTSFLDVPAAPNWYQPETIHKAPTDYGMRLVHKPPRCVNTIAAIFPPCDGDECPLQEYLLTRALNDANHAKQELENAMNGFRLAHTMLDRAVSRTHDILQVPAGFTSHEDVDNFNIHNMNELIVDHYPTAAFKKNQIHDAQFSHRFAMGGPSRPFAVSRTPGPEVPSLTPDFQGGVEIESFPRNGYGVPVFSKFL